VRCNVPKTYNVCPVRCLPKSLTAQDRLLPIQRSRNWYFMNSSIRASRQIRMHLPVAGIAAASIFVYRRSDLAGTSLLPAYLHLQSPHPIHSISKREMCVRRSFSSSGHSLASALYKIPAQCGIDPQVWVCKPSQQSCVTVGKNKAAPGGHNRATCSSPPNTL